MLEPTVTLEDRIKKAHERKRAKYQQLVQYQERGWGDCWGVEALLTALFAEHSQCCKEPPHGYGSEVICGVVLHWK